MPTSAAASAREILVGLHEIMAKRGSAQAKLDRVVDPIAEAMSSDVCSIYLLRDNHLELFATHGLRKEAVHVTRLRMGEGLVGTIAAEGRVLVTANIRDFEPLLREWAGEGRSHAGMILVPSSVRNEAFGVLISGVEKMLADTAQEEWTDRVVRLRRD